MAYTISACSGTLLCKSIIVIRIKIDSNIGIIDYLEHTLADIMTSLQVPRLKSVTTDPLHPSEKHKKKFKVIVTEFSAFCGKVHLRATHPTCESAILDFGSWNIFKKCREDGRVLYVKFNFDSILHLATYHLKIFIRGLGSITFTVEKIPEGYSGFGMVAQPIVDNDHHRRCDAIARQLGCCSLCKVRPKRTQSPFWQCPCKALLYCGERCQKKDWGGHKTTCRWRMNQSTVRSTSGSSSPGSNQEVFHDCSPSSS